MEGHRTLKLTHTEIELVKQALDGAYYEGMETLKGLVRNLPNYNNRPEKDSIKEQYIALNDQYASLDNRISEGELDV